MRTQTQVERNQLIVRRYQEAGQEWPATMKQVAAWALNQELWQPRRESLISQCAEQLAAALREEYYVDKQGRTVRTKHAVRVTRSDGQVTFWDDIRSANPKHMRMAFQQRRQQIIGDCKQLKNDVDSYNDNNVAGVSIQLVLDFTQDVAELETIEAIERRSQPVGVAPPIIRYPFSPSL